MTVAHFHNHRAMARAALYGAPLVAGLAGLRGAVADPALRAALALGPASRVLVIGSEGDTDPAIYRRIAGRTVEAVREDAARG